MSVKEAAARLLETAQEQHVRFPKIWEEARLRQECGAVLIATKDGGEFREDVALQTLIEKFDIDSVAVAAAAAAAAAAEGSESAATAAADVAESKKKKAGKKRPAAEADDEEESEGKATKSKAKKSGSNSSGSDGADESATKKLKTEKYECEENRSVGDAILEMGKMYFKAGDNRKGGVFSKAAKAIREAASPIVTQKEAMALTGVGKGIASYIVEFHESGGVIEKLEQLRAGQ